MSCYYQHTFDVTQSAGSIVYNYENLVRRDAVNIGNAGDNATIRLKTDNPGPWFLHWSPHRLALGGVRDLRDLLGYFANDSSGSGFAVVSAEAVESWNSTVDPPINGISSAQRTMIRRMKISKTLLLPGLILI
ncbi:hypothetical protein DFS33DRAFT_1387815 [Desarmillaria ectypa]|nr:hypothetical protein DFS33DRAFT_1387815 [Desarmillaria ectypa]